MPKDPRNHISVLKASRKSEVQPYPCQRGGDGSKDAERAHPSSPGREWKGARCSICMDHPHNAVLLLCGSHKKGCRPYVCDTSWRHSNCLGQFRKVFTQKKCQNSISDEESSQSERLTAGMEALSEISDDLVGIPQQEESNADDGGDQQSEVKELDYPRDSLMRYLNNTDGGGASSSEGSEEEKKASGLLCPLCRADVKGWKVVSRARHYLNSKVRACAMEGCAFNGTYTQLQRHARHVHPLARPCEVDSERMLAWQRMEDERELGDILSTFHEETSSNTLVAGDYIFDNDDDDGGDDENGEPQSRILSANAGVEEEPHNGAAGSNGWLSNLILHLFGPVVNDPARLTSNDSILQRQRRMSSVMTYMLQSLWGEVEDS